MTGYKTQPTILIKNVETYPLEEVLPAKWHQGYGNAPGTKKRPATRQDDANLWWKTALIAGAYTWQRARGKAADLLATDMTPEAKAAALTAVVAKVEAGPQRGPETPLQESLRAYGRRQSLNTMQLGERLGTSQSSVSRFLLGKPMAATSVEEMEERVTALLAAEAEGEGEGEAEAEARPKLRRLMTATGVEAMEERVTAPLAAEAEAEAEGEAEAEAEARPSLRSVLIAAKATAKARAVTPADAARNLAEAEAAAEVRLIAAKAKAMAKAKATAKARAPADAAWNLGFVEAERTATDCRSQKAAGEAARDMFHRGGSPDEQREAARLAAEGGECRAAEEKAAADAEEEKARALASTACGGEGSTGSTQSMTGPSAVLLLESMETHLDRTSRYRTLGKLRKKCLDLLREAAADAAETGPPWAVGSALHVLAAVSCGDGLGWRLASLLSFCAPVASDFAALEGVRTDERWCLLVRDAAGKLISKLMCEQQTHALRERQGQPALAGTPQLWADALKANDSQMDVEMAHAVTQLMSSSCFGPDDCESEITRGTIAQAIEAGTCPALVSCYLFESSAGRAALEETLRGYHRNVTSGVPPSAAGRAQRLQLIGHVLVDVGRLRVYGYSQPNGQSFVRHWLQQAVEAATAVTAVASPRRVLLKISELEIYFQIFAVIDGVLVIHSNDSASGSGWLEPNPVREGGGDGCTSAHPYGHPGGPTLALTVAFGAPPAPPHNMTPDLELALGGQLLHRAATATSPADQQSLLMSRRTMGMGQLWDEVVAPAFGCTSETQCHLLDSAGDRGLYPRMTDALSPVLYTLELATATLYLPPAGLFQRVSAYQRDSDVFSDPRQAEADHIWGPASRLVYHDGHAGNPDYMRRVSWTDSPWGNLLASAVEPCSKPKRPRLAATLPVVGGVGGGGDGGGGGDDGSDGGDGGGGGGAAAAAGSPETT